MGLVSHVRIRWNWHRCKEINWSSVQHVKVPQIHSTKLPCKKGAYKTTQLFCCHLDSMTAASAATNMLPATLLHYYVVAPDEFRSSQGHSVWPVLNYWIVKRFGHPVRKKIINKRIRVLKKNNNNEECSFTQWGMGRSQVYLLKTSFISLRFKYLAGFFGLKQILRSTFSRVGSIQANLWCGERNQVVAPNRSPAWLECTVHSRFSNLFLPTNSYN